jgi:hypothetical protein
VVGTGLLPAVQQYVLRVQAAIDNRQAELGATAGGTLQPLRIIDPAVGIPEADSSLVLSGAPIAQANQGDVSVGKDCRGRSNVLRRAVKVTLPDGGGGVADLNVSAECSEGAIGEET